MQPSCHRHGQRVTPGQHFLYPVQAADHRLQVASRQALLLHLKLDGFDGFDEVGGRHRAMLGLERLHQRDQHVQAPPSGVPSSGSAVISFEISFNTASWSALVQIGQISILLHQLNGFGTDGVARTRARSRGQRYGHIISSPIFGLNSGLGAPFSHRHAQAGRSLAKSGAGCAIRAAPANVQSVSRIESLRRAQLDARVVAARGAVARALSHLRAGRRRHADRFAQIRWLRARLRHRSAGDSVPTELGLRD